MRSFRSGRGAGGALCFVLIIVAIHPVELTAQLRSVSDAHAEVVNTRDTLSQDGKGEFLPSWHAAISNIPVDWLRFASIAFTPRYAPIMAATAGLTAALVATDNATWQRSHQWYTGSGTVKHLSDDVEFVGDGRPQFGLAAAFALYGFMAKDNRALRTGSQIVETILASGTVVQVLKHITGRESPFVSTRPGGRWDLFPNQIEYSKHVPHYDAFPSGHVTTALATVTVVVENYPEWWWARPVGYAAVVLLAVSMGNTGIHWYSDYPLAVVFGYSFGMIAAHPLETGGLDAASKPGEPQFSVGPLLEPQGAGIVMSVSF
ncbi:MAG TPA: phosphatase PAP2 family protein [Bacteroidota bacterium]|nr:phosphatase PAP2 family protein [Bacteroidota bacterium]